MSSLDMNVSDKKNSVSQHGTANRLLFILKTRGPQTIASLAKLTGTSAENIRQQIQKSMTENLVETGIVEKKPKAGRPVQLWQLTDKGHSRFPDTHADMTVTLLRHLESLGAGLTDRLITLREQEVLEQYTAAMQDVPELEKRIACLARLRSEEGYMAQWNRESDTSWLLTENHCPICAAATACQGFCRSELAIFQSILGDGCTVERCEHILTGARRCAYRITAL